MCMLSNEASTIMDDCAFVTGTTNNNLKTWKRQQQQYTKDITAQKQHYQQHRWKGLLSSSPILMKLSSVTSVSDVRNASMEFVKEIGKSAIRRASLSTTCITEYDDNDDYYYYDESISNSSSIGYEQLSKKNKNKNTSWWNHYFWMNNTAKTIYSIIILAIILRKLWILHVISIIIIDKIIQIIVRWTIYILDDKELWFCVRYIRGWFNRIIQESEYMINNNGAIDIWRVTVAYSFIKTAPTGMNYIRYLIRYKTIALRTEFLRELGLNTRFVDGHTPAWFVKFNKTLTNTVTNTVHTVNTNISNTNQKFINKVQNVNNNITNTIKNNNSPWNNNNNNKVLLSSPNNNKNNRLLSSKKSSSSIIIISGHNNNNNKRHYFFSSKKKTER